MNVTDVVDKTSINAPIDIYSTNQIYEECNAGTPVGITASVPDVQMVISPIQYFN